MTSYVLRPGMHLLYGGREHIIEQRLPDRSFQLKDLATNQYTAVTEGALVDGLFNEGQVELLGAGREYAYVKERSEKTRVGDLTALADDDPRKKAAKRRLAYVEGMKERGEVKFTKEFLRPVIEKVGATLGEMPHDEFKRRTKAEQAELKKAGVRVQPSPASLFRWYTDYEKAGGDIRALVPAFKSQGNSTRKISDDEEKQEAVLRLIEKVLEDEYMTLERPSVQECWESLVALIAKENRGREDEDDKLPIPHIVTLYRIINKIPKYERDLARYGQRIADNNHRANKQGPRPTRPLERVEADDTKLDMFVIDEETMLPYGRPWLIALIDVYTKMILGFYLSFVPPSYLSVMQCLLHAIRPKTYVRDKYPDIKHTWDTYGLPRQLVVDNAKHWICADFDEACQQLDIETQYCPVRHPWYKTSIERWIGTKNRTLHALPGTTFSNIFEREDYDPRKHAVISLELLEKIIHKWIIDIYQRRKHRGINDVPVRLWTVGTEKFPPALPPSAAELEVLLGHIEWRVVSKSGVEMFGLFYNSDRLIPVRSALKKGEKVKVKYDPMDISVIYVYDEHNGRHIAVPAVDQEYTKGLTLWQHEVIKRQASKRADAVVDIVGLCLAKAEIKEEVRKAAKALRKHGTNVRLARWSQDEKAGERRSSERESGVAGGKREARGKSVRAGRSASTDSNPARGISDFGDASEPSSAGRDETADRVAGVAAQPRPGSAKTKLPRGRKRGASSDGGRSKSTRKTSLKQEQPEPRQPERSRARSGRKRDKSGWGFDFVQSK
ncbi:MAG TPA: Mu transposase C-terminal domain-containing protein [Pyrinomonadaceae bacterium]|jgi:putative transposase|nr:Mu transposase C-terminal domain-containing protein [Pyrinomonadaceae bacterium]